MLLDICGDNFFSCLNNSFFIDSMCILVISLCLVLLFLFIYKNTLKHVSYIIMSIIITVLSFVLVIMMFDKDIEGRYCETVTSLEISEKNKFGFHEINDITFNKVIIVGDSRMKFIEDGNIDIPINVSFIAKVGAKIDWFKDSAVPQLRKRLDNSNTDYKYHVIINMGVNDIEMSKSIHNSESLYFNEYKKLFIDYPNVQFYLLSVNPINEVIYNKLFIDQGRTTPKVEQFNNFTMQEISNSNFRNLKYCDSYHSFVFHTKDGLHYTEKTNKDTLNYIINSCIDY